MDGEHIIICLDLGAKGKNTIVGKAGRVKNKK